MKWDIKLKLQFPKVIASNILDQIFGEIWFITCFLSSIYKRRVCSYIMIYQDMFSLKDASNFKQTAAVSI